MNCRGHSTRIDIVKRYKVIPQWQNEGLNEGLNLSEKETVVYGLIQRQPMTSNEIIQEIEYSHATVERIVKKLSELSLIIREGAKKKGYWKIVKK